MMIFCEGCLWFFILTSIIVYYICSEIFEYCQVSKNIYPSLKIVGHGVWRDGMHRFLMFPYAVPAGLNVFSSFKL